MTIENFIDILRKRKNDDCYDDYMYCVIDNLDLYVEDCVIAENTCFIFLTDKFSIETPKCLVADLKKHKYQKNWTVVFVYNNCVYEFYTSYKMYNNLILELH